MVSALLRRLRRRPDASSNEAAQSSIALETPTAAIPSHSAQELPYDEDALHGPPPRSYAQLSDAAHELIAASWDSALPARYWLNAVLQLYLEAEESVSLNDPETAFVRAETILKLLRDVLPRHHHEWQSLAPAEREAVENQVAAIVPLHSHLRAFLLNRTARFNARVASVSSTSASPALMLRNTISAASDSYVDSTARGNPQMLPPSSIPGPAVAAPPRANKLRSAYVASKPSGSLSATGAALPAPGDDIEDASLPSSALGPLLSRQEGRRIPRLAETSVPTRPVQHVPVSAAAPLPLPGEGDSDDEVAPIGRFAPVVTPPLPVFAYPVPPIPPTPPPSVLKQLAAASSVSAPAEQASSPETMLAPQSRGPFEADASSADTVVPSQIAVDSSTPLRKVLLPLQLIRRFVDEIACSNTSSSIETCGLLLGVEEDERLRVSHLLVPKQTGTGESCSMANEEEVANVQNRYGLLTLGWIHTHPTQSIFLSSVDLHTHATYQTLLREAIAVVCAPHEGPDAFGVFRLTDPPGMGTILACRDQDAFHPHPPLPLYTDVDQEGGHCQVREDLPFELIDLR